MRRAAAIATTLLLPVVVAVGSPTVAAAEPRGPEPKQVGRAYGDGPVRLAPRQGVDIAFRAERGDRVMLDVRSREHAGAACFWHQTITDARGSRTVRVTDPVRTKIMRVRTSGRAVLSFRGTCAFNRGQGPHPVKVQLTKVRMREVARNRHTSVRGARRGYIDVARVRVSRDARDTLTLRDGEGATQYAPTARVVIGNRLSDHVPSHGISVEAGYHPALSPSTFDAGPPLRSGQLVGLVVPESGQAVSLRAREHRVALDDPALTLSGEPGREHVLVYAATEEDRPYVVLGTAPGFDPWATYSGGANGDDPRLQRTIVTSDPDGADPQSVQVRVRRTVRAPDLVVGGPSVTFASVEPGTRFVSTIPVSAAGTVRLTATNVSANGPWGTHVPPVFCSRDCSFPGLEVRAEDPVADGSLYALKPHELTFTFGNATTGSVTLTLTDIP